MLALGAASLSGIEIKLIANIAAFSLVLLVTAIVIIVELALQIGKLERENTELRRTVDVDGSVRDAQAQALRIVDELVQVTRQETR